MILANYHIFGRKSNGYTSELDAIINYANSQGWTIPSGATLTAINTYINSLISAGIWNKYDIYYNFGYNDTNLRDFSRINWKNPGNFNITYNSVTLPNYTINGFEQTTGSTNTSSFALNTNFIPSTNGVKFTLNNASVTRYISGTHPVGTYRFYSDNIATAEGHSYSASKNAGPTLKYYFHINGSGVGYWAVNGNPGNPTNNKITTINRVDSSIVNHYINGTVVFEYPNLSTSLSNNTFNLLSEIFTATNKFTFNLFGVGANMNSTDNTNISIYYNTFKTSIGL